MKKVKLILILLIVFMAFGLSACNGGSEKDNNTGNQGTTGEDQGSSQGGDQGGSNDENREIVSYKQSAIVKLDELVTPAHNITEESLKAAIQNYYNTEKQYINGITDLDTAKEALNKVIQDTKDFVKETLKPLAIGKINNTINPLIERITYEELKESVQAFYNTEIAKINSIETLANVLTAYKEIIDDTKEFITTKTEEILISLKNKALEELDPYVTALINKIPFDQLKTDTQVFYASSKIKLDEVDFFDGFSPCIAEIKEDLEAFVLTEAKKITISKLNEVVTLGLSKISNEELKEDLTNFKEAEIDKLNAISKLEDVQSTLNTVITETEAHIKTLLVSTVKDYITRLTAIESATAYDYLPDAMHPSYQNNLVNKEAVSYDFTSFVNTSSINKAGYGEQWQMVITNINQSITLAKVFNYVQTILGAVGNAVDIYITNSYAEEMSYTISGENYNGLFEFKNAKLVFNIMLTKDINIPAIGSVKPIIKMEYDLVEDAKEMYISLGDAYKLKYVILSNKYEMATTYGMTIAGKEVSRSSYLVIEKEKNKTTGHIYEYTTYEGSDKIKACADFYIENGYVSVVGNKASGMIAFDSYINELYLANEGRLLGYEIREEKTISGVTATYNTLWFNIWNIQGIDNIKVTDKTDANKSSRSTVDVYINSSSSLLVPTYNTKLTIKTSRKYDVELRTRYYYSYDSVNDKYEANAIDIPMMFIQEGDNYSSFASDIKKDNNITASVSLNNDYLNKILLDYDTLINIFIVNKEKMSSEAIIAYLEANE